MAMPTLSLVDGPFGVPSPPVAVGAEDAVGSELDNSVVIKIEFIVVATSVCADVCDDDCVEDNDVSELLVIESLGTAVEPGSVDWLEAAV